MHNNKCYSLGRGFQAGHTYKLVFLEQLDRGNGGGEEKWVVKMHFKMSNVFWGIGWKFFSFELPLAGGIASYWIIWIVISKWCKVSRKRVSKMQISAVFSKSSSFFNSCKFKIPDCDYVSTQLKINYPILSPFPPILSNLLCVRKWKMCNILWTFSFMQMHRLSRAVFPAQDDNNDKADDGGDGTWWWGRTISGHFYFLLRRRRRRPDLLPH